METFTSFAQNWLEHIASLVSLVLSVIAIFVTMYTVKKQNKTSLFEKRWEVVCLLGFIADYAYAIKDVYKYMPEDSRKKSDSVVNEDQCEEPANKNKINFSMWVNLRLLYSRNIKDDDRLGFVLRAAKGKRDYDLADTMNPYFFHDLHILRQGKFLFKDSISRKIENTADCYEKFIDSLLSIAYGTEHDLPNDAKVYFDEFVKAGLQWREDSKTKKALNKDMSIV